MDEKYYFSSINIKPFLLGMFVCVMTYSIFNVVKVDQLSEFTKIINKNEIRAEEEEIYEKEKEMEETNILDGCYHVYLDVGSNIGVQARKLFEQDKYPNAPINPIFDSNFGHINKRHNLEKNKGKVTCAVGFEPNGKHTEYLKSVENAYSKCGWRAHFMTETAVSDHSGVTKFYSDNKAENFEWGAGILPPSIQKGAYKTVGEYQNVSLIRLSNFLKDVVGKRVLPIEAIKGEPPIVLMKMDIEGSEVDVIPDIIFTGGLQYINNLFLEWHSRKDKLEERKEASKLLETAIHSLGAYSQIMKNVGGKFRFSLINVDDESYHLSKNDLPKC